jgi:ABC-type lipoprotein release transport system permease subunit
VAGDSQRGRSKIGGMPSLSFASHELRRRRGRTITTALGLASGVGLVMGIVGVSQGLDTAQRDVLSPLRSVGTDILVTRTVAATSSTPTPTPSASAAPQQGGGFFAGPPDGGGGRGGALQSLASLDDADATALLNENSSVITDLSKLGKAGTRFTHDFFLAGTLITFPDQALDVIKGVDGVASATGALTMQAQHQTGTVPSIVASVKTGGETLTTTARPAAMTDAERAAVQACIVKKGGFGSVAPGPRPTGAPPGADGGGPRLGGFGALDTCLPKRFQEYQTNVITPLRTINQVVNPPSTDTSTRSWTAAGVDRTSPNAGLITTANLASGHWLTKDTEVLVSRTYAQKQSLAVGKTLAVNGTTYTVAGLVDPTLTGNSADVYFSLPELQKLAGKTTRINEVLVKVKDAGDVDAVAAAIKKALPGAQVVTGKDVADTVTGSLHDAQQLASRLGGALAAIVLLAAFAIAVLLTLSSVAKRVREIGTLRALGWSKGRVVGQLLTETLGIGVLGGVLGIGLGYLASYAVQALSPSLSATSVGVAAGSSSVSSLFHQDTSAVTRSIELTAPITVSTIALGMACALAGGLLAGGIGGWRAARLSPSVALRDLG